MSKENYILLEEKMFNLDETVMGVRVKDIQKILDWMNDNQMLSYAGKRLSDFHFKYYKSKGKL